MLKIKIVDFVSRVDTDEDTQNESPHVGLHIFPSFLKAQFDVARTKHSYILYRKS